MIFGSISFPGARWYAYVTVQDPQVVHAIRRSETTGDRPIFGFHRYIGIGQDGRLYQPQ